MYKKKGNNVFIKNEIIESSDSVILFYGLKILLLKSLHIMIFICIGSLFNRLLLTVSLYAILFALRSYTGGFHSKNPILCLVYSVFISIGFNVYYELISPSVIYIFVAAYIAHHIQLNSPIVYDDNPLSIREVSCFRSKILSILIIAILLLGIGTLFKQVGLIALGSYPIYMNFLLIKIHLKTSRKEGSSHVPDYNLEEG